jgi:hypothetical protein
VFPHASIERLTAQTKPPPCMTCVRSSACRSARCTSGWYMRIGPHLHTECGRHIRYDPTAVRTW